MGNRPQLVLMACSLAAGLLACAPRQPQPQAYEESPATTKCKEQTTATVNDSTPITTTPKVVFYRDVQPILGAEARLGGGPNYRCAVCHSEYKDQPELFNNAERWQQILATVEPPVDGSFPSMPKDLQLPRVNAQDLLILRQWMTDGFFLRASDIRPPTPTTQPRPSPSFNPGKSANCPE